MVIMKRKMLVLGTPISEQIASFKSNAPITSCDVEKNFSQYKSILRSNVRSFIIFKFENNNNCLLHT